MGIIWIRECGDEILQNDRAHREWIHIYKRDPFEILHRTDRRALAIIYSAAAEYILYMKFCVCVAIECFLGSCWPRILSQILLAVGLHAFVR